MNWFSENESKLLQTIFSWGSISYAAGFVTIMLHTCNLGIPVIELIEPIYIWIGIPLAGVIFFARFIYEAGQKRWGKIRIEVSNLKSSFSDLLSVRNNLKENELSDIGQLDIDKFIESNTKVIQEIVRFSISKYMPIPRDIIQEIVKFVVKRYLIRVKKSGGKQKLVFVSEWSNFQEAIFSVIKNVISGINFIASVLIVILACYLYIVKAYPIIPQSLGGGKPAQIIMFLDTDKLPVSDKNNISIDIFPNNTKLEGVVSTTELKLLYQTKEYLYLRSINDVVFSIDKDVVNGIIWVDD